MAMLDNVFVNISSSGYSETAAGEGDISLGGVRNYLNHPWPQLDLGSIKFHNPELCEDEVSKNRTLTRKQAMWVKNLLVNYLNVQTIPFDDELNDEGFPLVDSDITRVHRLLEPMNIPSLYKTPRKKEEFLRLLRTLWEWDSEHPNYQIVMAKMKAVLNDRIWFETAGERIA